MTHPTGLPEPIPVPLVPPGHAHAPDPAVSAAIRDRALQQARGRPPLPDELRRRKRRHLAPVPDLPHA